MLKERTGIGLCFEKEDQEKKSFAAMRRRMVFRGKVRR
jgi:hypothetical protein